MRCDLREGADGERVLMLHELQSDWMQSARRGLREQENGADGRYPFLRVWPALTLKLMLLHAAGLGAGAMAWTRGAHQAHRYRGRGAEGLKELYDRTLPRAAGRAPCKGGATITIILQHQNTASLGATCLSSLCQC